MMARRIIAVTVLGGLLAATGCGAGSRGEPGAEEGPAHNVLSGGEAAPYLPFGVYQPPPATYQPPPASGVDEPRYGDQDPPPPTYQPPPPSQETPPGVGNSAREYCARTCPRVAAFGCPTEEDGGNCIDDCAEAFEDLEPCDDEAMAYIDCILVSAFFDCELTLEEVLDACPAQVTTLVTCEQQHGLIDGGPNEPDPPGRACDLEGDGCAACETYCEQCVCLSEGDQAACTDICAAGI